MRSVPLLPAPFKLRLSEEMQTVFTSQEELDNFYELTAKATGVAEAPKVDFSTHTLVLCAMGSCSTGGHKVEFQDALEEGGVVRVNVAYHYPTRGQIVTQAFVYPSAFALVPIPRALVEFTVARIGDYERGSPRR